MIHPTAVISRKAKLPADIVVGPYTVIGDNVEIGSNTKIGSHCLLEGRTKIGSDCEIFTGAVIGSRPQDLKYKGEASSLEIGDDNIIREYVTFNPGTGNGGRTKVGSKNLFMAYAHIAHDCRVGDSCVFANNATLAGHVDVEDSAVIGGLVAVHQFVRVGKLSIIGGCSKVVQDIPPYSTCDGHPARVYGLNLVGLRRNKVPPETIRQLGRAFKIIFNSGLSLKHALQKIRQEVEVSAELEYLLAFAQNSQRGLSHACGQ
jgi:UDP-N-acetylglucosamine acyltransferase